MPFLPPNQQHQSTEGNQKNIKIKIIKTSVNRLYIGWSDIICLWSQSDCHFVGQKAELCEDLSHYSNKIESVGLRKCPYYRYLIEKVTSTDVRITKISQSVPTKWQKTADMKKLRHCHPTYMWTHVIPFNLWAAVFSHNASNHTQLTHAIAYVLSTKCFMFCFCCPCDSFIDIQQAVSGSTGHYYLPAQWPCHLHYNQLLNYLTMYIQFRLSQNAMILQQQYSLTSCYLPSPSALATLKRVELSTGRNVPLIFTKLAIMLVSQEMWSPIVFGRNPAYLRPSNRKWN